MVNPELNHELYYYSDRESRKNRTGKDESFHKAKPGETGTTEHEKGKHTPGEDIPDQDLKHEHLTGEHAKDENLKHEHLSEEHKHKEKSKEEHELHEDTPDVRGWVVRDKEGIDVGKVHDLVMSSTTHKAHYLDIVPEGTSAEERERHLLLPIGAAEIHENEDLILVKDADKKLILGGPLHTRGSAISRDHEINVGKHYNPKRRYEDIQGTAFYEDDYYNEGRFYEPRRKKYKTKDNRRTFERGQ